jgi:hypothetical protein
MKLADSDRVGTLPDFGNFNLGDGKSYDRYKGVQELMPWAKAVSAKSYDFDARGNETTIDYARMMKIVVDAGYHDCVASSTRASGCPSPRGSRDEEAARAAAGGALLTPGATALALAAAAALGLQSPQEPAATYSAQDRAGLGRGPRGDRRPQGRQGFQRRPVAAEPRLANPVCLYVTDQGDVYVAETFRH